MTRDQALAYVKEHFPDVDTLTGYNLATAYMDGYLWCLRMLREEMKEES